MSFKAEHGGTEVYGNANNQIRSRPENLAVIPGESFRTSALIVSQEPSMSFPPAVPQRGIISQGKSEMTHQAGEDSRTVDGSQWV